MHHRLGVGLAQVDVVAVEGDVDVAERNVLVDELVDQLVQAGGEDGSAAVDPDDGDVVAAGALDDLVGDADERAPHVLLVEDRLLLHRILPGLTGPG